MKNNPHPTAAVTNSTATSTANAAATITLAAATDVIHVLDHIAWSYDGTPTSATLTVTDGGTTIFTLDITSEIQDQVIFPNGMAGTKSAAMVVTLGAAGAGVIGKVNTMSR